MDPVGSRAGNKPTHTANPDQSRQRRKREATQPRAHHFSTWVNKNAATFRRASLDAAWGTASIFPTWNGWLMKMCATVLLLSEFNVLHLLCCINNLCHLARQTTEIICSAGVLCSFHLWPMRSRYLGRESCTTLCTPDDRPDLLTLRCETEQPALPHSNKPNCLVGIKRAWRFQIVSCLSFWLWGGPKASAG